MKSKSKASVGDRVRVLVMLRWYPAVVKAVWSWPDGYGNEWAGYTAVVKSGAEVRCCNNTLLAKGERAY